jgi:DNA-binding transcriptional LysR family regulator
LSPDIAQLSVPARADNRLSVQAIVAIGEIIMDRLQAIETFLAVATLGSFAAAARHLRVSPAAATRAVASLEAHLGTALLTRSTRSLRLTDAGRLLLDGGQQAIEELGRVEEQIRGRQAEPRGILTIAAPVLFGRIHVLPVVTRLLRDHQDLTIRLSLADRMVRLVDEGYDVAVRIGDLPDSGLLATRLGTVGYLVVGSPEYFRRNGLPSLPADLARHQIITFESLQATSEWQFQRRREMSVRLAPRLSVDSADAAIAAAVAGLGITRVLSYQVRDHLADGRLQTVLDDLAIRLPVQIVRPERRMPSVNVSTFIKAAVATIPPQIYSAAIDHVEPLPARRDDTET